MLGLEFFKMNFFRFSTIPVVILTLVPAFYDQTNFPKVIGLIICTLILLISNPNLSHYKTAEFLLLSFLTVIYLIIQFIQPTNWLTFLMGSNGRFMGFMVLIALLYHFLFYSSLPKTDVKHVIYYLLYTYYVVVIFGLVLLLNLLPVSETDNYGKLTITLQNPNFLSAFLGIAISVHSFLLLHKVVKLNIFQASLFLCALINLFATNSIQGFAILGLNFIIISLTQFKSFLFRYRKQLIFLVFGLITILIFAIKDVLDWLIINGSVKQRLNYWSLGLSIWKSNAFFGVGLDDIQESAFYYRQEKDVIQEGFQTAIDRAHNTIIDHLIMGGTFTGVLWTIFLTVITIKAVKLLNSKGKNSETIFQNASVFIWIGYLVQTLISVSPVTLTYLGYMAAGLIVGSKKNSKSSELAQNKNSYSRSILSKSTALIAGIALIIPISTISRFEIASANYVRKGEKDSIQEIKSANLVTNRTLERVMVKAIDLGDLSEAKFFAEKLEIFDPGRSTIYYTKSIYYDSVSNLNESRIEMLHALELNPLNCYFLLGSSVIDTKIGNFDLAQSSINKVFQLCPQMPGLPNTQKYLDDTKSQ